MPRGQGTGPMGMGAMTGRGAGFCAGYGMPGYANNGQGRGAGGGWRQCNRFSRGGMQGGGSRFTSAASRDRGDEKNRQKATLRNRAEVLQAELNHIRGHLDEMEP